jgi:hypothetical protein
MYIRIYSYLYMYMNAVDMSNSVYTYMYVYSLIVIYMYIQYMHETYAAGPVCSTVEHSKLGRCCRLPWQYCGVIVK